MERTGETNSQRRSAQGDSVNASNWMVCLLGPTSGRWEGSGSSKSRRDEAQIINSSPAEPRGPHPKDTPAGRQASCGEEPTPPPRQRGPPTSPGLPTPCCESESLSLALG